MALDNLLNLEFTAAELSAISAHLEGLESIVKSKSVQLTKTENKRYGKLGLDTENWVNSIFQDTKTAPDLVPFFIDKVAWANHEKVRDQLMPMITRLENLTKEVVETNRLVGYDIYHTCLSVYQNVRFLSTQNVPGTKVYYEKWKLQFPGNGGSKSIEDSTIVK